MNNILPIGYVTGFILSLFILSILTAIKGECLSGDNFSRSLEVFTFSLIWPVVLIVVTVFGFITLISLFIEKLEKIIGSKNK